MSSAWILERPHTIPEPESRARQRHQRQRSSGRYLEVGQRFPPFCPLLIVSGYPRWTVDGILVQTVSLQMPFARTIFLWALYVEEYKGILCFRSRVCASGIVALVYCELEACQGWRP